MANKISTIIEFETQNAASGLKNLKSAMGDAEGFTGKLKAGFGSLASTAKTAFAGPQGVAMLAAGAGAAIGAAGVVAFEAASKFSDLGVEIGKFADATGLSNEQSSRWIEVAGDIGIDAGTLEGVINKMNKAAGATPEKFEAAGIAISRAKDGTVDANKTFLNTIQALNGIRDPARRAKVAAELLGKGWTSVAELIGEGSAKITTDLAAVEKQKVFDDEKVAKARAFRKALDELHDSFEDITIAIGQDVAPALTGFLSGVANAVTTVTDGLDAVSGGVQKVGDWFGLGGDKAEEFGHKAVGSLDDLDRKNKTLADGSMRGLVDVTLEEADAQAEVKRQSDNTKRAVKQNIDEMISKWDELTGNVDDDKAWVTLQQQFVDVQTKFEEANTAIKDGSDEARAKTLDYKAALDDLITSTVGYGKSLEDIPPEKLVSIKAALDAGDLQRAEDMLAILTRNRSINLQLIGLGAAGYGGVNGARAAGGPVAAGGNYLVGEKGPEVVHMGGSGTVIPNGSIGEVHIHVQSMPSPNELVALLAKYSARNGPGALRAIS